MKFTTRKTDVAEPSSIRMVTRLLGLDDEPPAAALGAIRTDSMRPMPARSPTAAGATTVVEALACGTTTVVPVAPTEYVGAAGAAATGATTTGAGAEVMLLSVVLAHPATTASAIAETIKGTLFIWVISCLGPTFARSHARHRALTRIGGG